LAPFVTKYIRSEDESVIELIIQVADFLTEVMQGPCVENQRFLCAGDLLLNCSRALNSITEHIDLTQSTENIAFVSELPLSQQLARCEVRSKLVVVCQAVIEAARNYIVPRVVISKLEASILRRVIFVALTSMPSRVSADPKSDMTDVFVSTEDTDEDDEQTKVDTMFKEEAFSAYFLMLNLIPFDAKDGEYPTALRDFKDAHPDLLDYLSDMSGSIEILRDGHCYTSHFCVPQRCLNLRDQQFFQTQAESKINDIARDNPDEKALQLLTVLIKLTATMKHLDSILTDRRLWWAVVYKDFISEAPFRMSLFIVFGLVLMYGKTNNPYYGNVIFLYLYRICAYCHILLNGGQTLVYFMVEAPVTLNFERDDFGLVRGFKADKIEQWQAVASSGANADTADTPPYMATMPDWPNQLDEKTIYRKTFTEVTI